MTPTSLSRFFAATFAVVSTAALVFADDPTRPVEPFDVAQTPAGQAVAFTTTGDQSQLFRRSFLEIADDDADAKNAAATEIAVDLDPNRQFQTLDGFGAAITGSTAFNLFKMTPEDPRAPRRNVRPENRPRLRLRSRLDRLLRLFAERIFPLREAGNRKLRHVAGRPRVRDPGAERNFGD